MSEEKAAPILNSDGSWGMNADEFGNLLKKLREANGIKQELHRCDSCNSICDLRVQVCECKSNCKYFDGYQ